MTRRTLLMGHGEGDEERSLEESFLEFGLFVFLDYQRNDVDAGMHGIR